MDEQPAPELPAANDSTDQATGEVVEVLPHFGVAHVRTADGRLLGLNRKTPALDFDSLRVGQRLRLSLETPFMRVTCVEVLN